MTILTSADASLSTPIPPSGEVEIVTLENGLTCWLRPHKKPEKQIYLCLQLGVGSLLESEQERGICHFLEHLAFRGTEHFPGSEWITFLESLGHRFGTHQNAFTGLDQTNYFFSLADHRQPIFDKALLGLADIAFRMGLKPDAIERERSVILEEYRNQQHPKAILQKEKLKALFPRSALSNRDPLGLPHTISGIDESSLRGFYQRHYRPENALLMIVGDFDLDFARTRIRHHFESWPTIGSSPVSTAPEIHQRTEPSLQTFFDPTGQVARVEWMRFGPYFPLSTVANFRKNLLRDLVFLMLHRRLQGKIHNQTSQAFEAKCRGSAILNLGVFAKMAMIGKPENLLPLTQEIYREIASVLRHGLMPSEHDSVRKILLQNAKDKIDLAQAHTSRHLLWQMKAAGRDRLIPIEPETQLSLLRQTLSGAHLDDINQAAQAYFGAPGETLLATVPTQAFFPKKLEESVLAVMNGEAEEALAPPPNLPHSPKLKVSPGPPGLVTESWRVEDLNIDGLTFENGIRCQFRPMTYHKEKFYLKLVLASGRVHEPDSSPGITDAAAQGLFQPSSPDIHPGRFETILLEKNLHLNGTSSLDDTVLYLSGHNKRLAFALTVAHFILANPNLHESVFNNWCNRRILKAERQTTNIRTQAGHQFWDLVTQGDPRLQELDETHIRALDLEQCRTWLTGICHQAPLEVAIVGDIDLHETKLLVQKYLGSLPFRRGASAAARMTRHLPAIQGPQRVQRELVTTDSRCSARLGWRSVGWLEVQKRRHLSLAELIFTKELRQYIREDKGLTYTIQCHNQLSKTFANGSFFLVDFLCDPQHGPSVATMVKDHLTQWVHKGFNQTQFEQARHQALQRVADVKQFPQYWQQWLGDFHYRRTSYDTLRTTTDFFKACTRQEVVETLREIMVESNYFETVIRPTAS